MILPVIFDLQILSQESRGSDGKSSRGTKADMLYTKVPAAKSVLRAPILRSGRSLPPEGKGTLQLLEFDRVFWIIH